MYLQLGEKPCLVVSTAAAARDFFKTHDLAFASRPRTLVNDVLYAKTYRTMPSAPYGDYWRLLRCVCGTHLFSHTVHASHQAIRQSEIRNMVKVLVEDHARVGDAVDLFQWLTGVTANVLTMMLTNNRFFDVREKNQEKRDYDVTLKRIFDAHGRPIISDYVPYLRFITKLQGWEPYLQELQGRARSLIGKIIEVEKHKERATEKDYVPDFRDVLLRTPLDDGKTLADADIATLLSAFLNAGTDTSATTVEWAMAELMANPEVRTQAQAELDAVVGQERLVEEPDIANLPLLQAIVQETYRLHPATALALRHQSHEPRVVSGWEFPVHMQLIYNIYAIHRDPSEYLDADEFKPSRFLGRPDNDSGFRLIPFGVGRRMCPGSNLGNTMVSMLLATLLHNFDSSLPSGETVDMAESSSSLITYKLKPLRILATPAPPLLSSNQ